MQLYVPESLYPLIEGSVAELAKATKPKAKNAKAVAALTDVVSKARKLEYKAGGYSMVLDIAGDSPEGVMLKERVAELIAAGTLNSQSKLSARRVIERLERPAPAPKAETPPPDEVAETELVDA